MAGHRALEEAGIIANSPYAGYSLWLCAGNVATLSPISKWLTPLPDLFDRAGQFPTEAGRQPGRIGGSGLSQRRPYWKSLRIDNEAIMLGRIPFKKPKRRFWSHVFRQ